MNRYITIAIAAIAKSLFEQSRVQQRQTGPFQKVEYSPDIVQI
jgi:hypothetical protein